MKLLPKKRGFTFIEVVLTIIVVGIIAGVTAKVLLSGLDTYSFITNRKDAAQHARVAMERMIDELLLVEWDDVTWMGNEHLTFIDRDNSTTSFKRDTEEGIPILERGNDFLAGPLGLIDFDYLREDGSVAYFNTQLRRINIELAIDALGGHGIVNLRSEVFPRNFMYDNFREQ